MRISVALQYFLPHRFLSRVVYWATRWTWRPWKNFLIATIVKKYRVDMSEALESDPLAYPFFNAFFTRALKPGARAAPADPNAIACPADGTISQIGRIQGGRILQAKGRDYTVSELLGSDKAAEPYGNGSFVTVYLSPRDYHRVHAPLSGTLRETLHIPGRIFSVAPATVEDVPRLFARNERLVCHFDGDHGPFAVVLVGAMLVSGIETVWSGVEVPPYARDTRHKCWIEQPIRLRRFDELGRFNMGSTVILLLPPASGELSPSLTPESAVKVGQSIGRID
ncbi:MAG TPA: archaetidylserine decarboxylase [Rudaea sp.]|nr:archaetidylserine decarboxylase [Rudaea sp.]